MELIGLSSDLLEQLNRDWQAYRQLEASKERQIRDKSLENTLLLFKRIASAKNITLLLTAEKLLLNQELSLYANSPEENNSIKMALSQLTDAELALQIVQNAEAYRHAAKTYPAKRKDGGLPLDSFREFIKSHTTRLTNRLTGHLAVPEKEILRQRKLNLALAKNMYIEMQKIVVL